MVEFAVVLPILALILFATIEYGYVLWQFQQVSAATSEGARRGIVIADDTYGRLNDVQQTVISAAPGVTLAPGDIAVSSTWSQGDPLTVTTTANIGDIFPFVPAPSTLSSTRTMKVA